MSAKSSEAMLGLLQELALLKEMDQQSAATPESGALTAESEQRQRRRSEIAAEIKALGAE